MHHLVLSACSLLPCTCTFTLHFHSYLNSRKLALRKQSVKHLTSHDKPHFNNNFPPIIFVRLNLVRFRFCFCALNSIVLQGCSSRAEQQLKQATLKSAAKSKLTRALKVRICLPLSLASVSTAKPSCFLLHFMCFAIDAWRAAQGQ